MGFVMNLYGLKASCLGLVVFIFCVILTNIPVSSVSAEHSDFCIKGLEAKTNYTMVRLIWDENEKDVEYRIERSEINASEGFKEIDAIQSTFGIYVDKSIVINKDYWYRIVDNTGCPSSSVHVFFPERKFNHSPSIESTPSEIAEINDTYVYNVIGLDPEKKNLTWKLDIAPAGMSINDKKGQIVWTPTEEFKDSVVSVLLSIKDESGVSDQQFFTINIKEKPRKNSCYIFFDPMHFKSTDITPNKFYNELSIPSWIVPPYELHIFNGNPDGTQRISSVTIDINGTQIINSNDITQAIAKKSYQINLRRLNSVNTTLTGQKNSFISLQVCGAVGDLTPPQININNPTYGSVINNPTPIISIYYEDITGNLESSASGIDISSFKVIIDNKDYSRAFKTDKNGASAIIPDNLVLTKGKHVLYAAVKDNADNHTSKTINFTFDPNRPPLANRNNK